jgi:PAS domain S-box-containing protein
MSRILIVEDDLIVAESIKETLISFGHEITGIVTSGEEGIQFAALNRPDLTLMDIHLRGRIDGLQAAKQIWSDYDIPVIFLTAYADPATLEQSKLAEPYGYILKPFQEKNLQATIEMALFKHRMEQRVKESEARYRAVMNQTADAIILVDNESLQITEANIAFYKLLGFTPENLSTLTVCDLVDDTPSNVRANLQFAKENQQFFIGNRKYRRQDGTYLDVEVNVSNIQYQSQEILCLVIRDISERKKAEQAEKISQESLEKLAVAEERTRLSRELHDSVAQSLYSLTLFAEAGLRFIDNDNFPRASQTLRQVFDIAHQALKEMRLFIYELRPPTLEQEGLIGALRERLNLVENRAKIQTQIVAKENILLSPAQESGLYWIAQEALNNILKYANANLVVIELERKDSNIEMNIIDNGIGFDLEKAALHGGMGMKNMEKRAELLCGRLNILSESGKGTRITTTIPIQTGAQL